MGRTYQDVVRINSQSGKGGVAYVLQTNYGVELPRWLQIRFSQDVQKLAEEHERELNPDEIWNLFRQVYMGHDSPYALKKFSMTKEEAGDTVTAVLRTSDGEVEISGDAFGTLGAFVDALEKRTGSKLRILNYTEHAMSAGTRAEAIAYVEMDIDGHHQVGVATSQDNESPGTEPSAWRPARTPWARCSRPPWPPTTRRLSGPAEAVPAG